MAKLTVLVCPMDWGLGHASRCVPVIRAFLDAGCRVVVAADGGGRKLIEGELGVSKELPHGHLPRPEVTGFPGFRVSWHGRFPLLRFIVRLPFFLWHTRREGEELARLVSQYGAQVVVSDNRYGLAHPSVYSVIITHQLRPSLPSLLKMFEGSVAWMVRRMVGRFDECWIPDCPGGPVAGKLVRGWERLPAAFFVGLLSRFGVPDRYRSTASERYRLLFVLSGPEPARTIFEGKVRGMMRSSGIRALLVQGLPDAANKRCFLTTDKAGSRAERQSCPEAAAQGAVAGLKNVQQDLAKEDLCFVETEAEGDLHVVQFLDSRGLLEAMEMSGLVVCRSGYSTVCDLLVAGREAVLVPTPGQTEQEYLGRWLSAKGYFRVISQEELAPERLQQILAVEGSGKSEIIEAGGYAADDGTLLRNRVAEVLRRVAPSEIEHQEKRDG